MSFWCRRCTEQSRSHRCMSFPCVSPMIWNSTWRGRGDDARDVQVAVARRGAADAHVVVREPGVQAVAVRLGVHRDGLDPQLLARTDHPQGDLPAVRDQHLLEHQGSMSPRRPAAAVLPPKARLSPDSTPDTLSANSLGLEA